MRSVLLIAALLTAAACGRNAERPAFRPDLAATGIPDLQAAMTRSDVTARELVLLYLARIATYENRLNGTMAINPRALEEAEALDAERRDGRVRGPLHGVPIAIKDNIHVAGMPTTAGALAFRDLQVPYEARLVHRLRAAGAVIIAKTMMTELASWMSSSMPSSYNAVAGFSFNPYDPRPDLRPEGDGRPVLSTGGSSSGVGTAAGFWAANVGTDTGGSILVPSQFTMLVGVRPTVGLISRHGVVPLAAEHDTPGPMARSVTDAAILLGALASNEREPEDPATGVCEVPPGGDYTSALTADALRGVRLGVPLLYFVEPLASSVSTDGMGGIPPEERAIFEEALRAMESAGAVVLRGTDVPSITAERPDESLLAWPMCSGSRTSGCSSVLFYGMKRDFNAWLRSLGPEAPVDSLTELRQWNDEHVRAGARRYGQDQLDASDAIDLVRDRASRDEHRRRDLMLTRERGIDAALANHRVEALVLPGWFGAGLLTSRAGYPAVTVPAGMVPNRALAGSPFETSGARAPYSVTFVGSACSEPRLLAFAFAYEQASRRRVAPPLTGDPGAAPAR